MTTATTLTMTVSATEPIAGTFPIELDGPGLHLLEGPPEAGKSNILESLLFAYLSVTGGQPKRDRFRVNISWQAREAAAKIGADATGQITLPGLKGQPSGVKIYETQIRRLPAPPAVQILDGTPFVQLTRNGLTAPATRQAAERSAFAAIIQERAKAADLVPPEMAADVAHLELPEPELLSEVSEKVRLALHALKGRCKDDAAATERKLNVCRDQADTEAGKANVGTLGAEQEVLERLEGVVTDTRIARRGRERDEANREQYKLIQPAQRPDAADITARLAAAKVGLDLQIDAAAEGLPPKPNIDAAKAELDNLEQRIEALDDGILTARETVADLERKLAAARESLTGQLARRGEAIKALDAAQQARDEAVKAHASWEISKAAHDTRKATVTAAQRAVDDLELQARQVEELARQWDARQALIDAPITGPEQAEVDEALARVTAQREAVAMARRKQAETTRQAEQAQLEATHKGQMERATTYEAAAIGGLKGRISAILTARQIDGWAIADGVLMGFSPKAQKMVPFSDLSRSTQDMAALKLMLTQMPVEPSAEYHLVLVPQEGFDGTTEAQRSELSRVAREAGRYLLSARVAEGGDLRVVKVA